MQSCCFELTLSRSKTPGLGGIGTSVPSRHSSVSYLFVTALLSVWAADLPAVVVAQGPASKLTALCGQQWQARPQPEA